MLQNYLTIGLIVGCLFFAHLNILQIAYKSTPIARALADVRWMICIGTIAVILWPFALSYIILSGMRLVYSIIFHYMYLMINNSLKATVINLLKEENDQENIEIIENIFNDADTYKDFAIRFINGMRNTNIDINNQFSDVKSLIKKIIKEMH